jgi:hypothetical protein
MPTRDASTSSAAAYVKSADEVTARAPIMTYSCSRLGRTANPPGFSFGDWLRFARRRKVSASAPPEPAHHNHDHDRANAGQRGGHRWLFQ